MNTYEVTASRDGRWWMVHIPAIDGLTQARYFGEVEEMARSLIAITVDLPKDSFNITVRPDLDRDVQTELATAAALAETARKSAEQASARRALVAKMLKERGWNLRDIGTLLEVSYQRVHQLLRGNAYPKSHRGA